MIPNPIHPVVVHFPIVLAVVLPISALAALWAIARNGSQRGPWLLPAFLSLALTASAFAAIKTGEIQEDRVEPVVGEAPLHAHEEGAELFLILSGGVAILMGAGLLPGVWGRSARTVSTLGTAVLLVAGARVGASGGELVYEHGAAQAYAVEAFSHEPSVAMDGQARPNHQEKEDDGEGRS